MSGDGAVGAAGEVDYAVPAALESGRTRRPRPPREPSPLWGGPLRRGLIAACWVLALVLALVLVVPLASPDPTGAESPEAAVEQLVQGIADLDPVAIVGAVDPAETADPDRARTAYERLDGRLLRNGEVPPAAITAAVSAAEGQVGGADLSLVTRLAAVEIDLEGLELSTVPSPTDAGLVYVVIDAGVLDVELNPFRLPDGVGAGAEPVSYPMPLAEGWRRDRTTPVEPVLATVERDGRWYVSLEASAAYLVDDRVLRRRP